MVETRSLAPLTRTAPLLRDFWSDDPLADFRRELDRLFDGFFNEGAPEAATYAPRLDLRETDEHLELAVDLPGIAPENLDLNVRSDLVSISGRRESDEAAERAGWHRRERSIGRFERAIRLPFAIDPDQVQASYDNGVLNVRIAKPENLRTSTRRIPITHQGK